MGQNITRDARIKFNVARKKEMDMIDVRYKNAETRNVLLVGHPQSGKTQLFRNLLSHQFQDNYIVDESAKFGFKTFSTIKSKYENLHPRTMHIVDSPGAMIRNQRGVDFYFEKCDVIFIVMDISLILDITKIENMTQFVLGQVAMYHQYIYEPDVIEPFICHVFSKQDRVINKEVQKRNAKAIKSLARQGVIGNYLFVSAKTGAGMDFLKQAMFDADIKDHGDKVRPYDLKEEQRKLQKNLLDARRESVKDKNKDKGGFGNDDVVEEKSDEDSSGDENQMKHANTSKNAAHGKGAIDLLAFSQKYGESRTGKSSDTMNGQVFSNSLSQPAGSLRQGN